MNRDMEKFDKERLAMQLCIFLKPRLKDIVEQIVDGRLLAEVIDRCLKDYFSVIESKEETMPGGQPRKTKKGNTIIHCCSGRKERVEGEYQIEKNTKSVYPSEQYRRFLELEEKAKRDDEIVVVFNTTDLSEEQIRRRIDAVKRGVRKGE